MQVEAIVALNLIFLILPLIILNLLPNYKQKNARVFRIIEEFSFSLLIGGVLIPITVLLLYALLDYKFLIMFQNLKWRIYFSLGIFSIFLIRDLLVKKNVKKTNLR